MWFLTIVLLMFNGTEKVIILPTDTETACYVAKEQAQDLHQYGVLLTAVSCAKGGKEA